MSCYSLTPDDVVAHMKMTQYKMGMKANGKPANVQQSHVRNTFVKHYSFMCNYRFTLAAMEAAVMCEEELSSVEATPLSFFSSSSSSHCTPLSSVWRCGLLVGSGDGGGGGEGRSSSSLGTSFTLTTASRRRSMACGRAGRMNWKHSCKTQKQGRLIKELEIRNHCLMLLFV